MPLLQIVEVLIVVGVAAGESLHPHAGIHQINSERRRGYRGRFVAANIFGLFHSLSNVHIGKG